MATGWWQATLNSAGCPCEYTPPNYNGVNEGDTATTDCLSSSQNTASWVWNYYPNGYGPAWIQTSGLSCCQAPTTDGTTLGQTATIPCLPSNTIQWTWHLGDPGCAGVTPHLTTDVATQCPCLIFADDFDCSTALGKWWNVQGGSMTIAPDSPLYYGTAYWTWSGSAWVLNTNSCLLNCTPVTPSITPTYDPTYGWQPSSYTTGCNGPTSNANQVRWKWVAASKLWVIDYGCCTWAWQVGYCTWTWDGTQWQSPSCSCGAPYPPIIPVWNAKTNTWNPSTTTTGCPAAPSTGWVLQSNSCIDRCVPVQPTIQPVWNSTTNQWNLSTTTTICSPAFGLGPYCYSGAWVYPDSVYGYTDWEPNGNPCIALQPPKPNNPATDGQIAYTSCPTNNHAVLGSNTKAMIATGKNKTNDMLILLSATNPAPNDEVRIYFDGGRQYAYFKFSTVEDGNYTQQYPQFYLDDREEEGEIGIYDGTQRIGHDSWYCQALSGTASYQSWWLGLWIRNSMNGSQQVASAIMGSNAEMSIGDRGPGMLQDVAEAYVTVSSPGVGIGSGQITSGRTFVDRVSVSEASRSWLNNWESSWLQLGTGTPTNLTPADCSYSVNALFNDYYSGCWSYGVDNLCCVDGIPPNSITVEISGVVSGQSSNQNGQNYSNPPCTTCNSLNGTYVLTRNDECWQAGCDGYAYAYIGDGGCGSFTIALQFDGTPNTGYSVQFSINPCIPPIWQNCGAIGPSAYGNYNLTPTGTNGLLNCLGNDLIGANISIGEIGWGNGTWQNPYTCFGGTLSVTGVSYND